MRVSEDLRDLQRQMAYLSESIAKIAGETRVLLFGEFAAEYLANKLANPTLRSSTKKVFQNQVINHLIPAFRAVQIEHLTNICWLAWVSAESQGSEVPRFFNARKCLIEILNAAKNDGHIQKVPKLDNPDAPKDVGRALKDSEIRSILKNTSSDMFRFFFFVLLKTGCRPREILRWEWSMFDWGEPGHTWIRIPARITKTDRARRIPLNPAVSRRLWKQYSRGLGSAFVFPHPENPEKPCLSYANAWRSACARAKVQAVPYDLRRTFLSRCAGQGLPLLYVAKLCDTSVKLIESVYAKAQVEVMERIVL